MKSDDLGRLGCMLTLITLFLLPWQTRYIFWRPWVGTTESEFGVISLYATMLLAGGAALCFLGEDFWRHMRSIRSRLCALGGIGVVVLLAGVFWIQGYPSVVHAWTLNVFFAISLGYATYKNSVQNAQASLFALGGGFAAPIFLGGWQMVTGFSPESTLLGLAVRDAKHLGDAVLVLADTRILRMYGSFPHPNIFGAALALTLTGIFLGWMNRGSEWSRGMLCRTGILFAGIIAFVLFCISRSAALALLCVMFAGFGQVYKRKVFVILAFLLPVLIWTMQFIAPELLALRGNTPTEVHAISERVAQVNDWFVVMGQGGVLGVGIYHYPEYLASLDSVPSAAWTYQPVHNVFMLIIAEVGVLWSVFVLLLGGSIAWRKKEKITKITPLLMCLWSLAWFDHIVWTSWAGMAYTSVTIAIAAQLKEN